MRSKKSRQEEKILIEKMALSVAEMAEALGIARTSAYTLIKREGFPVVRLGQRILIPVDGLNAWLRKQTEGEAN